MVDGALEIKRYLKFKSERYNNDARWELMAPFIAPSRMGIINKYVPGEKQTTNVYDSTSMAAAETMAMFMAGHIINPSQQWLNWQMVEDNDDDQVVEWLEECRDRFLKWIALSAFYAEGPESLIDYGGFGTGCLMWEESPQPVNMTITGFRGFYVHAERTGRFVIADGANGLVDTLMREFEVTGRVARDRWGLENLSEKIQYAIKGGKLDDNYKIIHIVKPRDKSEQGAGAKGMPWASLWIELETKHVILESGYHTFPAAIPRYHRTPGEVYGRGRGDIAFPDTWTLNSAKKMSLEDLALKIKPPVMVRHDSVIGTLRLTPGGPTTINTHGMPIRDAIMPWQTGSNPEVTNIREEELRKSIREIFYVDAIRQLLQVEKSEMTAFEFAKKIELLFRILGPVYGRLEYEYLCRSADIGFDLMLRGGAFSPPPPGIFRTSGEIRTVFQNPIAKAQRAGDAEAVAMTVQDLAPLVQLYPQIMDRIDPDKLADGIMELRGVPAKWMRSDDELVAFRQAKQQMQQQEAAVTQANAVADSAGKVAPLVKALQRQPQTAGVA